eukprot:gene14435-17064_t
MADTPEETPVENVKVYSLEEVAKHTTQEDCWLVVDGKVYDTTQYLEDHPGGVDVMLESSGRDATEDFEDVGHSKNAKKIMEKYYIGEFEGGKSKSSGGAGGKSGGSGIMTVLQMLLPILIAIVVYLVNQGHIENPLK